MNSAQARVPTAFGAQYLTQLCKHFGHKLEVEFDAGRGVINFPEAKVWLEAASDALVITVEAADAATVERMQGVVERHLDRFAFREVPLQYNWAVG